MAEPQPSRADVVDPEQDPTATWALEPEDVAPLLARVAARSGAPRVTTRTPLTGAPLADVPTSTPEDVVEAVERSRTVQRGWARRPVAERAAVLLRLHDLLLDRASEVLDLVQLENGKARTHAYEEMADVVLVARHYARRAGVLLAPRRVQGLLPGLTSTRVVRHPVGVVGVVGPFNYPFNLTIGDALAALVAGNGVVIKPDAQTPLTALWGAALLEEAGLPPGLLAVVHGDGRSLGEALVDAVDHVVLTGSTPTGRTVAARAGERLVGTTLELGGKNVLYVAPDADPQVAAEGAVRACFSNSGQLCVSVERLLLHEDVSRAFLAAFVPRVRALRLGAGLDYTADIGSLTSRAQLERVRAHVDDALARGATVLAGGVHRTDVGPLFYEPTVLAGVPDDALATREETFGPVVSVRTVRHEDDVVRLVNAGDVGLSASIWTRDTAHGRRLAQRLEVGMVNVNEGYAAAWGSTGAPLGGVKASGTGRRHGPEGLWATTWTQTVAVQRGAHHGLGLGRLYAMPADRWTALFTQGLRAMRRFGLS